MENNRSCNEIVSVPFKYSMQKKTKKLSGSEKFSHMGDGGVSVLDFWQYGFSNLNSNILRGVLAEFIVESALKDSTEIDVRNPWGDYDVLAPNGKRVEVKSCSYIQDWEQSKHSRIVWAGLKAKNLFWSSAVGMPSVEPADYKADEYVLTLLKHQDSETLNILDLDQWCFWVLSREQIKELSKNGGSISLVALQKKGILPVEFGKVREEVERII